MNCVVSPFNGAWSIVFLLWGVRLVNVPRVRAQPDLPFEHIHLMLKPLYMADNVLAPLSTYLSTRNAFSNLSDAVQHRAFGFLRNTNQQISQMTRAQDFLTPELKDAIKNPALRADIVKQVMSVVTSAMQLPMNAKLRKSSTSTTRPPPGGTTVSNAPYPSQFVTYLSPPNVYPLQVMQPYAGPAWPPIAPTFPFHAPTAMPTNTASWYQEPSTISQLSTAPTLGPPHQSQVSSASLNLPRSFQPPPSLEPSLLKNASYHEHVVQEPFNPTETTDSPTFEHLSLTNEIWGKQKRKPSQLRFTSLAPLPIDEAIGRAALELLTTKVTQMFGRKSSPDSKIMYTKYIEQLTNLNYPYPPYVFASMALHVTRYVNQTAKLDLPPPSVFNPRNLALLLFFRESESPESYAKVVSDYIRIVSTLYTYKRLRKFFLNPEITGGVPKGIPLLQTTYPSFSSIRQALQDYVEGKPSNLSHNTLTTKNPENASSVIESYQESPVVDDKALHDTLDLLSFYESKGVDVYDVWIHDLYTLNGPSANKSTDESLVFNSTSSPLWDTSDLLPL